ncbi:MAG TPA: CYCXC family (seleno)protein [Candidatus Dormibacteraeota bacterium]|nr:CYCXC family (seleno)protein [Candidatus Dormibacteraeota bacterium]
MRGKHLAVAVAFSLMLVGSWLIQLPPVILAAMDPGGAGQMDMLGPTDQGIPSYHAYALRPPYPATLDPKQFPDALNRNVYALAAKIKPVLFQQPCYCYCDRTDGHKSLLDCFASTHGSECDICQKEAILAYQMTRKGKSPAQIRAAIIHGDWKSVDLKPYAKGAIARG